VPPFHDLACVDGPRKALAGGRWGWPAEPLDRASGAVKVNRTVAFQASIERGFDKSMATDRRWQAEARQIRQIQRTNWRGHLASSQPAILPNRPTRRQVAHCGNVNDMTRRARIAGALVATLYVTLPALHVGYGDAGPAQIHREAAPVSFVAAPVSEPQSFVRTRDSGPLLVGRARSSNGEPARPVAALAGSFTLGAAGAAATRRHDRRRTPASLAVAPSRSPPSTAVA
jgi:hypothetical protein